MLHATDNLPTCYWQITNSCLTASQLLVSWNLHSKDLLIERLLAKLSFLHTYFLENKVQIDKNKYGKMLFMSKQVRLPKITVAQSCKKWNSPKKVIYTLFSRKPSIVMIQVHVSHTSKVSRHWVHNCNSNRIYHNDSNLRPPSNKCPFRISAPLRMSFY